MHTSERRPGWQSDDQQKDLYKKTNLQKTRYEGRGGSLAKAMKVCASVGFRLEFPCSPATLDGHVAVRSLGGRGRGEGVECGGTRGAALLWHGSAPNARLPMQLLELSHGEKSMKSVDMIRREHLLQATRVSSTVSCTVGTLRAQSNPKFRQ